MKKIIVIPILLFCCLQANGQDYLKEANACFEIGDYECAKKNYTLFQALDGKDMSEQIQITDECMRSLNVANEYFKDEEYEKASKRYQHVLENNPKDTYAKKQYLLCKEKLTLQSIRKKDTGNNKKSKPYVKGFRGYKGIFDLGYHFAYGDTGQKGHIEINTSHGYQINKFLFAGVGSGLHIYRARDAAMKDPNNYPHYVGTYLPLIDFSYKTLPVFLDIRGYLPLQNNKITPFAMFRSGYAFNLNDDNQGVGIYYNPAVGIKYIISPIISINFSIGYSYQSFRGEPYSGFYGYFYVKDHSNIQYEVLGTGGVCLKLGVEF